MPLPVNDLLSGGFNQLMGFKISHWQENQVELVLKLQAHHLNRSEIVHGGVIATLLDVACGLAGCFCNVEGNVRRAVTLGLHTNFIATTQSGIITTRAKTRPGGFRIFFSSAEVFDENETLLAVAQGEYQYVKGSELLAGKPFESSD